MVSVSVCLTLCSEDLNSGSRAVAANPSQPSRKFSEHIHILELICVKDKSVFENSFVLIKLAWTCFLGSWVLLVATVRMRLLELYQACRVT